MYKRQPSTCQSKQYKLFNKLDYDDHANPSIMALSDQRLVLFFSAHGGTKNSPIYYAVSKYPSDISSWEEVQEINPEMEGSLGVCYTNPVMSVSYTHLLPELMDSYNFLNMFTEAEWNDAGNPGRFLDFVGTYDRDILEKYRTGADLDLYPNSDWMELLSDCLLYTSRCV